MTIMKTTFAAMALLFFCTQQCLAQPSEDTDEQWKDWKVTINTSSSLQHYLKYPGSSIHGITRVTVTRAQPDYSTARPYEDLWYAESKPIGCKRFQDVDITPGTAGIIHVLNVGADQCASVSNAALRVFLELSLRKCMTKYIVVPHTLFNTMVSSFRQQGFRPAFIAAGTHLEEPGRISIEIMSDNKEKVQRLIMR